MRLFRSLLVLVVLCLILGAPVASAAERPAVLAGREVSVMVRILGHLQDFLKPVWASTAGEIDPLGRNSPGAGDIDDPATPSTDEAGYIDPLG